MRTRRAAGCLLLLSLCCATHATELRTPLEDASALQQQINRVVEQSSDSVFAVTAFADATSDPGLFQKVIPATRFVQVAERAKRSCGSAFALDKNGYLLTNEHVVSGATSVWVTSDDGQTLPALVVATDPRADLAVLKIPITTAPLEFADAHAAQRGDLVVAIGNPGGVSMTGGMAASVGNISAVGRALPTLSARENRFYGDLLQITTPIATGSSGGPLLNLSGQCVGVVCAVIPNSPVDQNIGFAIALSADVRIRIELLKAGRESVYGYLGVNVSPPDGAPLGARVDHVDAGTPAVGVLVEGDVIEQFDGHPVSSDLDFIRRAGTCSIDRDVPMKIVREGVSTEVVIRPRRRILPIDPVSFESQRLTWAGVTFANESPHGIRVLDVVEAIDSPLKVGQVVDSVNGKTVRNLAELLDVLHASAGDALEIELRESAEPEQSEVASDRK